MKGSDKRKYTRHSCKIKLIFDYYTGNPEDADIDIKTLTPNSGKGMIIDISRGGIFIVSSARVPVGMPIIVKFPLHKEKMTLQGRIVRTGFLKNNPSEIAKKFIKFSSKGDYYIAVEFDKPIEEIKPEALS